MSKNVRSPYRASSGSAPYEDSRSRLMAWGVLGGLFILAVLVALLVWAVYTVDVTVLRWWAAGATLLALPLWILGYVQGKADSHALRAGIQTGVSAVMSAATATAELRVRTAQTLRSRPTALGGTAFNVYLPGQPGLGAAAPDLDSLLPPADTDTVELL